MPHWTLHRANLPVHLAPLPIGLEQEGHILLFTGNPMQIQTQGRLGKWGKVRSLHVSVMTLKPYLWNHEELSLNQKQDGVRAFLNDINIQICFAFFKKNTHTHTQIKIPGEIMQYSCGHISSNGPFLPQRQARPDFSSQTEFTNIPWFCCQL